MANLGAPPQRRPLQRSQREPEVFGQLLEAKWRAVSFPCSSFRTTLDHSLVFHKYYGVDGVNVEDTGLDGLKFEATIPLFNTIAAAPSETWGATRPFPDLFQKLWAALRDKKTGELQHPLFGPFDCKVQQCVFPLEADKREGSEITVSWVETTPLVDTGESERYRGGPMAAAKFAAVNLDASMTDLRDLVPEMPVLAETFDTMMNKISATFDRISIATQLYANKPAQLMARVNQVQRAAERARDAQTWPIIHACESLREAMRALFSQPTTTKRTRRYKTPTVMSLPMIANTLKVRVDDLIALNKSLVGSLEIASGTTVIYFG